MKRPFFRWISSRTPTRGTALSRTRLHLEELGARILPSANILSFDNENTQQGTSGTGVNSPELQLNPVNVNTASFGKLYSVPVDGQVYAEPLVKTGVTIASGSYTTPGSAGVHNVVFVATENDTLYAIDSSYAGGKILWQRSFLNGSDPSNTFGVGSSSDPVTAISTQSSSDVNSGDITPSIGITGTPVIDPNTNTLYVIAATRESTQDGATHFVQRLHAINLADGTDRVNPFLLGDTTNGNTNHTPIYTYGSGYGSVTDPYNGTGQQVVQFNALTANNRSALSLVNGQLYASWASHGDSQPYHGWVVTWNVSNVQSNGLVLKGVLDTSPNGGGAGIWQGSGGLGFEPNGSAFYFETGNGFTATGSSNTSNPVLNAQGFPGNAEYDNALVKVTADPTSSATHQNANGWGLKVADYFIPYNTTALDASDQDFGSGAPLLLPTWVAVGTHQPLLVAGGKEGKLYLLDRNNLGKFDPNNDHVVNAVPNGNGNNTPPGALNGDFSTPAWFNGQIYAIDAFDSTTHVYQVNLSTGALTQTAQTSGGSSYLSGAPFISVYGSINGILWTENRGSNEVDAFDASNPTVELWNSNQQSSGADNPGSLIKFAVPTVANGAVYVGTDGALVVYGLKQPASAAPQTPTLSAGSSSSSSSSSSVLLSWNDPTVGPNIADAYRIQESTDDVNFTQVGMAPAGGKTFLVKNLATGTPYYFRIQGFNNVSSSRYSNVVSATTASQSPTLNYSNGFAGATGLTSNGSAAVTGSALQLTSSGTAFQAASTFSTQPVAVNRFSTQFTLQISPGAGTADGMTFTIQGAGPNALGQAGSALGYQGIPNSVAIKFDLYSNAGEGIDSTGLFQNGAAPTNPGSIDLSSTGIDLHSGDPLLVGMIYDGTTLTVTLTDLVTGKSATQQYTVNIPAIVGSSTAYVGFTAATGGATATQQVTSWSFWAGSSSGGGAALSQLALFPSPFTSTTTGLSGAGVDAHKLLSTSE